MLFFVILGVLGLRGIDSCIVQLLIDNLGLLYVLFLVGHHLADAGNAVVLLGEVDETYTLGGTAHDADVGYLQADEDARLVDDHEVVLVGDNLDGYQTARLLGDGECLDTLGATGGLTIVLDLGALAVAVLGNNHDGLCLAIVDTHHAYHLVVASVETHADDTGRDTAHRADVVLVEAYGTSVAVGEQQLVVAVGQTNAYHLVAIVDVDGAYTGGTLVLIGIEAGLLDDALLGGKDDIV